MLSRRRSPVLLVLFAAGSMVLPFTAARAAERDCASGFVEVTAANAACGFALTKAGAFSADGRTLADPLVSSYLEGADGTQAIPAGRVILFPVSPSGRYRILQICDDPDPDSECGKVVVFDKETAALRETEAGHYGPEQWQSWSPDGSHVVLVDTDEGAWWLHVIDPASGEARDFPGPNAQENWIIEPETLRWSGPRSFTVMVKTCEHCRAAHKEIRF